MDKKRPSKPPRFSPKYFDHGMHRPTHAKKLDQSLSRAQTAAIHATSMMPNELHADGFSAVAVSLDEVHHLQLAALQERTELLQFHSASERSGDPGPDGAERTTTTERAVLWVTNEQLTKLRSDIASFVETTSEGSPRYQALVANIGAFEPVTLTDLWRDDSDLPSEGQETLWELWYHDDDESGTSSFPLMDQYSEQLHLTVEHPVLQVGDYISCVVSGTKQSVEMLLNTRAMPVEIRRPSFMEELETLGQHFVEEWVQDFVSLVDAAAGDSPVVTILDNGLKANHPLLSPSLRGRAWSVLDGVPGDDMFSHHGTHMAGVALFGDLRNHLDRGTGQRLELTHGIEAVRVLRGRTEVHKNHRTPGLLMAKAVAEAEIREPRNTRVFLIAQTMTNRSDREHALALPTTWSTALDALAMGCLVEVGSEKVKVGQPEPGAQRLFCVSIGNVRGEDLEALKLTSDFPSMNLTRVAEDPSQAWNVLRIGAYTDLDEVPGTGHYEGWQPLSVKGGLSPYSRTGVAANKNHGAVPDIVLEGGNLLRSPGGDLDHPSAVSVITTSTDSASLLTSTYATSAATAQAARLAAMIHARYPDYRPETVRGLMVHRAEWTTHMATGIHGPRNGTAMTKGAFDKTILRTYGWGVPREARLLNSQASDVTMVIQDKLKPFDGQRDPKLAEVKFYKLPWSKEIIEQLESSHVELRVTLSYFVEPNPGKRGANHHSTYPSHGLQFLIKSGTQSSDEFHRDIAESEDDDDKSGTKMFSAGSGWVAGPSKRDRGSLRSDMWRGAAYKLLDVDEIAIVPLTGWWKTHRRTDRCALDVPYGLIITLRTLGAEVDLYTNISNTLGLAIPPGLGVEPAAGQLLLDI